jgi:hypothetical protein
LTSNFRPIFGTSLSNMIFILSIVAQNEILKTTGLEFLLPC